MPYRFKKIREVVARVQRARSVATAVRLAGQHGAADREDLYWPDLVDAIETLLPSSDELGEALADITNAAEPLEAR